jgi:hypothetical protein
MKMKFGLFEKFKVFKALMKNQIINHIKAIRCDGGGEYKLRKFHVLYKKWHCKRNKHSIVAKM